MKQKRMSKKRTLSKRQASKVRGRSTTPVTIPPTGGSGKSTERILFIEVH